MTDTTQVLRRTRKAQDRYLTANHAALSALQIRDHAIVEAIRAGVPYQDIVQATGLTMGRLSQLKRAAQAR
jgi:uncharacterized protein YerC